jgi:betaine-aldehyde dehydrogenase
MNVPYFPTTIFGTGGSYVLDRKWAMYIDGEWTASQSGDTKDILNPFNQEVIATVPRGDARDAQRAIQAARRAFDEGAWRNVSATERGALLYEVSQKIRKYRQELAELETWNTGKTVAESLVDMDDVAGVFQYYAGLADKTGGFLIESPHPHSLSRAVREPIGVCALITPWNYPLLQASWKLAPALAAGNTLILKPAEITPLTSIRIMEIFEECGIPRGVVNIVLGPGCSVGMALAESHAVDLVSFTGGGVAGRQIMQAAAGNFKRVAMELGGKNPNIVFADADFDTAVDYALNAVFYHAGQVCSAGARLLVERSIHRPFVDAVVERMSRIRLGNGFDPQTQMGPLISAEHLHSVERYIETGIAEGAKLRIGGKRPSDPALQRGFFMEPTLFDDCQAHMHIVQEESFGPVLTVETFDTEDEAVHLANQTVYGLSSAVWTRDLNRAERVSHSLRFGTVWINDYNIYFPQAPWGGYKQSGIGRELSTIGIEEYTEVKHLYTNFNPQPANWFGT